MMFKSGKELMREQQIEKAKKANLKKIAKRFAKYDRDALIEELAITVKKNEILTDLLDKKSIKKAYKEELGEQSFLDTIKEKMIVWWTELKARPSKHYVKKGILK